MWAERGDARRWISGALGAIAVATTAAACATSAWVLAVALAVASAASGVSCALAQGSLVEAQRHDRERAMTRWELAATLGDVSAPILVTAVAALGLGWQRAMLAVAAVAVVDAVAVLRGRPLPPPAPDDDAGRAPSGLGSALRDRTLVLWLIGTAYCALLDELFVAFAAIHLRRDLGATETATAFALSLWAVGAATGLLASNALLRRATPRSLLVASSAACFIACWGWLAAGSAVTATIGLFVVGAATAPLYPIAKAQVYAACPGRPALVGAATQILSPIEIATPWLFGLLADRAGLRPMLASLSLEPIALFVLALAAWPRQSDRSPR